MRRLTLFYELLGVLLGSEAFAQMADVCQSIETAISSASGVYYPGKHQSFPRPLNR